MHSILVVEDNKLQREKLINIANEVNNNIKIYSADRVENAYNIATNEDIGAFFIDIQLLDGSGIDLAKKIREIEMYQFTPIVFITGIPTKEMKAFHDIHSYDYILKPYSEDAVKNVMVKILINYYNQKVNKEKYLDLEFKGIKQRDSNNPCYEKRHALI